MKSTQLDSHPRTARTASATADREASTSAREGVASHVAAPAAALPVALIGQCAGWFQMRREGEAIILEPRQPLPRRCTIRPAAMFDHDRGFADIMTVMGRLVFPRESTEAVTYTPFTRDPQRRLREVFLPVEAMPDDDWPMSVARWSNHQAIAKRLLSVTGVAWGGLSQNEMERLTTFGGWTEPLEGCILHALTQATVGKGECVIEIGSFRGRSLAMLALALRGARSDAKLLSVDPHTELPHNAQHVRNALAEWGEERRLMQHIGPSDEAHRLLRPGCASFIFIDGDHSFDAVVKDFENYRDLLAPGGVMAFHDYGCGPHNGREEADHEVRPAVDEHVFRDPRFRPLLLAHTLMVFRRGE